MMMDSTRNNFKAKNLTRSRTFFESTKQTGQIRAALPVASHKTFKRSLLKQIRIYQGHRLLLTFIRPLRRFAGVALAEYRACNLHQRLTAWALILLLISALGIQTFQPVSTARAYALTPVAQKLVGSSRDDTAQYLKLSQDASSYDFTVPELTSPSTKHGGRNDAVYSTSLSTSAGKGITYTDSATKIAITVTPKFDTATGRKMTGDSIVYPAGADQVVYTHKYNGLKEDIIVPRYRADKLSYKFELVLPSGVEARLDGRGNIGIFSADSSLFGNITFGSDKDSAAIDSARKNAPKTNLVATIPAPIVKDADSKQYDDKASFTLSNPVKKQSKVPTQGIPKEVADKLAAQGGFTSYELGITTMNIQKLHYPISVDPTIQSTSASDFLKGSSGGMLDIDTSIGLIRRSALTGGTIGAWTTNPGSIVSPYSGAHSTVIYNGKIYLHYSGSAIMMGTIAADGSIGALTSTGQSNQSGFPIAANGYYYFFKTGTGEQIKYSKINADGSLNAFVSAGPDSLTDRDLAGITMASGYVYIAGGRNSTTNSIFYSTVQYAPVNADGTIGTWVTAGNSLVAAKAFGVLTFYNDTLYLTGGVINTGGTNTSATNQVEFTKLTDGVPGAWTTLNTFTGGRFSHSAGIYNGYLYIFGGYTGATNSDYSDTQYAPIYTDGTVGTWATSASLPTARRSAGANLYNGILYSVGGLTGAATTLNEIRYAQIDPSGKNTTFSAGAVESATALAFTGSVAANGYIYAVGGCSTASSSATTCTTSVATVSFATVGTDGTLTWTATTSIPEARYGVSVTSYNGYLIVTGGCFGAACTYRATSYTGFINANGSVTTWSTAASNGSVGSARLAPVVAHNGYLYMFGGINVSTTTRTDSAPIGTTGVIGTWTQKSNLPSTNVWQPGTVVGDKLYAVFDNSTIGYATLGNGSIGAWTSQSTPFGGNPTLGSIIYDRGFLYFISGNTVQHVRINSDGSLDTTVITDNTLATARNIFAAYSIRGYLIVTTGCTNVTNYSTATCGSRTNSSEVSLINSGGNAEPGSWTTDSTGLPLTKGGIPGSLLYNGYIYVSGGKLTGGANVYSIYYASLSAAGVIGTWAATTALPGTANNSSTLQVYNGRIYAQGNGGCGNQVIFNTVNANGTLGASWTTASATIPGFLCNVQSVIYHNRYYVVGGWSGTSGAGQCTATLRYADIDPTTGMFGSWTTSSAALNTPRGSTSAVLYNGYLYLLGGFVQRCGASTTFTYDVEFAKLDTDGTGTVGSFNYTTAFPVGHARGAEFATNGYIYSVGGQDEGANISTGTRYAPILSNGQIGRWETSLNAINTPRIDFAMINDGARVLMIGGSDLGSTSYTNIERASLRSIARVGTYTRLLDFEKGIRPTKFITRGTKLDGTEVDLNYATVNNADITFTNAQTASNIGYDGANAQLLSLGANVTLSRYFLLKYTINDTQSASFPDVLGGQSTVTDYDIYYTPNSAKRLRGGQTFTGQQDGGLDAP